MNQLSINLNLTETNLATMTKVNAANQIDFFEHLTIIPEADPCEFRNADCVRRYTKTTTRQLAGNLFSQISLQPFVWCADWKSFPVKVGDATYHFVITELREHDILGKEGVIIEIVQHNGCGILRLKSQGKKDWYGMHYLDLHSLVKAIDRVKVEHTITSSHGYRSACFDPFDTFSFSDLVSTEKVTPIAVNSIYVNGQSDYGNKPNLWLTELAADAVKGRALSGLHYSIHLNKNDKRGTYSLDFKYQTILGGFPIAYIDKDSIPDGIFREEVSLNDLSKSLDTGITALKEMLDTPTGEIVKQFAQHNVDTNVESGPRTSGSVPITEYQAELKLLTVTSHRIELPKQKLASYDKIRAQLIKAGGKYHKLGFNFSEGNALEIFETVLAGKRVKSKKQEFAFFATGLEASQNVVNRCDIQPYKRIFEPHAGHGAIADIVRSYGAEPIVNELWDTNAQVLRDKGYSPYTADFLTLTPEDIGGKVDTIVGNPPWGNLVDIDHFNHALTFLKEGGEISMIVSGSALMQKTQKALDFQALLHKHQAETEEVPSGSFDGTPVVGQLIHIKQYHS